MYLLELFIQVFGYIKRLSRSIMTMEVCQQCCYLYFGFLNLFLRCKSNHRSNSVSLSLVFSGWSNPSYTDCGNSFFLYSSLQIPPNKIYIRSYKVTKTLGGTGTQKHESLTVYVYAQNLDASIVFATLFRI